MNIACLCKLKPRVSVDRYTCFEESAASIVRERLETSYSDKQWAAQCAKYKVVRLVARQIADSIVCRIEIVYQTARGNNSRDRILNRLLTSVRIYNHKIYVLDCSSHTAVSVHWGTDCEFRSRKEFPRILEITSQVPPFPLTLLYSQPHIFYYTTQPTAQVQTLIALVKSQVTKPQM